MLTITDADRATLDRAVFYGPYHKRLRKLDIPFYEAAYLAGLRAGMLRAAEICGAMVCCTGDDRGRGWNKATEDCAAAIRAAAEG